MKWNKSDHLNMNTDELLAMAFKAQENAYAPYSRFKVGAALELEDGSIYTGCNIENISFTPTVCAERVAVFKAVSDGKSKFSKIVVVTSDSKPSSPCGVCLQVLSEFVDNDFKVILANKLGAIEEYSFTDLLGRPFRSDIPIGNN